MIDALGQQQDYYEADSWQMPKMPDKAYRWVAEMEEIATFVGEDPAGAQFYLGAAKLFERIAADLEGPHTETDALNAFATGNRIGNGTIAVTRGLLDTLVLLVPAAIGVAIYPFFSDLAAQGNRGELAATLLRFLRVLAFLFIPLAVGVALLRYR